MAPSLRPVPFRPPGPVDPGQAAHHVAAALPDLDDRARTALALVEVAGRPRAAVAVELGMDAETLADALARARKALRRSLFPLSSTGWCERAERLLSDELDGVLEPPGPARLEAHLRHCGRCVEHERRLAQARDALVRDYAALHGPPEPEPEVEPEPVAPPAALRIVPDATLALEPPAEPEAIEAAPEPRELPAAPDAPRAEPEPEAAPVEAEVVQPEAEGPAPAPVEPEPAEPEAVEPEVAQPEPEAAEPAPEAAELEPEVVELVPLPVASPPLPEQLRHPRVLLGVAAHGNVMWSLLHVTAIVLALLSVALTALAATGAVERVF